MNNKKRQCDFCKKKYKLGKFVWYFDLKNNKFGCKKCFKKIKEKEKTLKELNK